MVPIGGSVLVDQDAYELMRTLREAGVPASTVLRLALRAADAGRVLARELGDVLAERPPQRHTLSIVPDSDTTDVPASVADLTVLEDQPPAADVIDLVTTITRGVLGSSSLARP